MLMNWQILWSKSKGFFKIKDWNNTCCWNPKLVNKETDFLVGIMEKWNEIEKGFKAKTFYSPSLSYVKGKAKEWKVYLKPVGGFNY